MSHSTRLIDCLGLVLVAGGALLSSPAKAGDVCSLTGPGAIFGGDNVDPETSGDWAEMPFLCSPAGSFEAATFFQDAQGSAFVWSDFGFFEWFTPVGLPLPLGPGVVNPLPVPLCRSQSFMTRFLTADRVIWDVSTTPRRLHFWQSPQYNGNFYAFNQDRVNGYIPEEQWGPKNATNVVLGQIHLYCPFAYRNNIVQRAAILVHEQTHEDVGHIGDDKCLAGASCDTFYGDYNATTMEINFLLEAASSYGFTSIETSSNLQRQCGYVPLFSWGIRQHAIDSAKARNSQFFAFGSVFLPISSIADADSQMGTPWDCTVCNTDDDTAPKGKTACNEAWPKNVSINLANRTLCQTLSNSAPSDPNKLDSFRKDFKSKRGSCYVPSDDDLDNACSARLKTAKKVSDVNADHLFDDSDGFDVACEQRFCQQAFTPDWTTHNPLTWSDATGCMDTLCGGHGLYASPDYASLVDTCRTDMVNSDADPYDYLRPDELDSCKQAELTCLDSKAAWTTCAGLTPSQCLAKTQCPDRQLCYAQRDVAASLTLHSLNISGPHPHGPGPYWKLVSELAANPAALSAMQSRPSVWHRILATPEFQNALFGSNATLFTSKLGVPSFQVAPGR